MEGTYLTKTDLVYYIIHNANQMLNYVKTT